MLVVIEGKLWDDSFLLYNARTQFRKKFPTVSKLTVAYIIDTGEHCGTCAPIPS
jgi:hypothetical protein